MEQRGPAQSYSEPDNRSLKDIIADVVRDIEVIFRSEIRLAGAELKTKLKKTAIPGGFLAVAGLLGFFAMACFIMTCIVALNIVLPLWLSALIIAVLLATAAGGAFVVGRMGLQKVDPVPQRTLETMKDNIEWAKTRARS